MSIYNSDWQDKPAGYYADPKIRAAHDKWRREEDQFSKLVDEELRMMGYEDGHLPTREDIKLAEDRAADRMFL